MKELEKNKTRSYACPLCHGSYNYNDGVVISNEFGLAKKGDRLCPYCMMTGTVYKRDQEGKIILHINRMFNLFEQRNREQDKA